MFNSQIQCRYNGDAYLLIDCEDTGAQLADADGSIITVPFNEVTIFDINILLKVRYWNSSNGIVPTTTLAPLQFPYNFPITFE